MMASPRSVSFYPWMICVLILLIERPVPVGGYSKCYNDAEKAYIPAALMCYNNHVVGPRVVLDVFRAKESSPTNCECTVTSDTPTKFNFSNYNNYHPGSGCGSTLMLEANGVFNLKQCYVENMQLPSANLTDTSVDITINGPQSAISTDYCVLIESDVALNISCKGDSLSSLLTTQTVSTTETMETGTTPTTEASTQQTTSQTLPSITEKLETTSIIVTTLSQSISSSTNRPIATTEEIDTSSTSSLLNSSTTSSQTIDITVKSTEPATLETTSVIPDTSEKGTTKTDIVSSTQRPQTTTQMSSTNVKQDTTTLITTNSSTESSAQGTTTIVPPMSSTESGAQDITTTDMSKPSTGNGEQQTTSNATTLPSTSNNIQMTSLSASTESSTVNVTQHTTASTALPLMSTHGVTASTSTSSVTQKATTVIPIVKTTFRQATAEVPWNGIIPAILLGVILLAALLIAFIKWQRSREIKYPPDSSYSDSVDSSNKYPPMGETNFGYDAYEADLGIVTEFSKSPEELEIEYADEELDPKNLTKGQFIRYNVKDYRNIDSVIYNCVRKQAPNGMDVYF